MKYADGKIVALGDRVKLADDANGVVVALIDFKQYLPDFPSSEWKYLKQGVLIKFPSCGVIHYETLVEPDVELIERS